jgi:hypothetical protein
VVVTTDQILTEDQRKSVETALRERKRKAGTADRPLFLFGGAKIEKPTLTLMDMQFLETRNFLRSEIFSIFKVPEPLAGYTQNLNDGGAGGSLEAVKGSFIESTIGSLCAQLEFAVDPIVKTFGDDLVGWFDIDSLPIMQSQRRARWDTAGKMFGAGVPVEDINLVLDLGLPDRPWYKNGYLPFNLQEVTAPVEPMPSETEPATDEDEDETKSNTFSRASAFFKKLRTPHAEFRTGLAPHSALRTPFDEPGRRRREESQTSSPETQMQSPTGKPHSALRTPFDEPGRRRREESQTSSLLWKKHVTARKASVNLFKGKVSKVLNVYRGKTLAKLEEILLKKSAGRLGEIHGPAGVRSMADLIFDHQAFGESLNQELNPAIAALLQQAGEELMAEVGFDDLWKYPPQAVVEFLAARQQEIMGVGCTVCDQLNAALTEGDLCKSPVAALCERRNVAALCERRNLAPLCERRKRVNLEENCGRSQTAATEKMTFAEVSEGVENGEAHAGLVARVKAVFNKLTQHEAGRVARTEVNIGYNTARHQAMVDAGVQFKLWLSGHGPHVRPAHAAAEEAYLDSPIPINEPFVVMGEQLMFPGDSSLGATPENVINCQCVHLAARPK